MAPVFVGHSKLTFASRITRTLLAFIYECSHFTWSNNALPFHATHGVPSALSRRFADYMSSPSLRII